MVNSGPMSSLLFVFKKITYKRISILLNDSPLQVGDLYVISYFQRKTRKSSFGIKAKLWPTLEDASVRWVAVAGDAGLTRTGMGMLSSWEILWPVLKALKKSLRSCRMSWLLLRSYPSRLEVKFLHHRVLKPKRTSDHLGQFFFMWTRALRLNRFLWSRLPRAPNLVGIFCSRPGSVID